MQEYTENQTKETRMEDVDFYEKEHIQKAPGLQVVCFRISQEWYAAEIGKIIEVIPASQLTPLPSAPPYIVGITNLRGEVISVTDPKVLFNLERVEQTAKTRIVVVSSQKVETGLLVDEVTQVRDVEQEQIDPPLSTLSGEKTFYLKGEFLFKGQLITILDIEHIIQKTRFRQEEN